MGVGQHFSEVYYSNFWYSRFYRQTFADFDGNIAKTEIEFHEFRLRLLALFFGKIYIPRAHLLTFRDRVQQEINGSVFQNRTFGYLYETGVIAVSTLPGLDVKDDNERITQRSSFAEQVVYPDDPEYIKSIPITPSFEVDTSSEAKNNSLSFPKYGERLRSFRPELHDIFVSAAGRAETSDIPFFHEEFLGIVREGVVDDAEFEKIWRDTNSIYLTTAGTGDQCVAYYNNDLESPEFRRDPGHVDRYLFNPNTLYMFLGAHFSQQEISKLLHGEIEQVMPFLDPASSLNATLKRFQVDYQKIASNVAAVTRGSELGRTLNQQIIRPLLEMEQYGMFAKGSKKVQSILDDASKLARAGDLDGVGLASAGLSAAVQHGQDWWRSIALWRRYRGLTDFVNHTKGLLKN